MEPPELYLDAAATTPPLPAVIAVMQQLQQTAWANPSSLHGAGLAAAEALERARWTIAERFAVNPDQLIVTSGATESVHLALLGSAAGLVPGRLVISAVEHPAVVAAAHQLEALGWTIAEWPVDGQGVLRLDQLDRVLSAPTRLVSLIAAQGEVGALQPISTIARACRERGVDLLTLSAHKFRGPRGVGLLIRAQGVDLSPLQGGGGQEHGLRSGTEPVALVGGMAEALMALPSFDPVSQHVPPGNCSNACCSYPSFSSAALHPISVCPITSRCWPKPLVDSRCRDAIWCDGWRRRGWPAAAAVPAAVAAVPTVLCSRPWAFPGLNVSRACG